MIGLARIGKASSLGHEIGALFKNTTLLEPAVEAVTLGRNLANVRHKKRYIAGR